MAAHVYSRLPKVTKLIFLIQISFNILVFEITIISIILSLIHLFTLKPILPFCEYQVGSGFIDGMENKS